MGAPRHGPPEMSFLRKRNGKVNAQKAPCLDAKISQESLRCKKNVKISLPECKRTTCQIAGNIKKRDRGKESVAHFGGKLGRKKKILGRKSVARLSGELNRGPLS